MIIGGIKSHIESMNLIEKGIGAPFFFVLPQQMINVKDVQEQG